MRVYKKIIVLVLLASFLGAAPLINSKSIKRTEDKACFNCAQWNAHQSAFKLFGESYYVGTKGLSAVLIVSAKGLILIDGGLPQSAAIIFSNVRSLGFDPMQIEWILNSHAHFDHAGGLASLAQLTGARVAASPDAASALRSGLPSKYDPQAGFGEANRFPTVKSVYEFRDNDTISLGEITLTAHTTPGHTPGGMSYSWRSCEEEICRDLVYADSLNAVSAPGFKFSDIVDSKQNLSTANLLQNSIEKVANLPCDIIISVHPENSSLLEKQLLRTTQLAESKTQMSDPLIDRGACKAYAKVARERLRKLLLEEAADNS